MMMKKKTFSLLLAFLMALTLVMSGCRSKDAVKEKTAGLTDEERSAFIQNDLIGDATVLNEDSMTLIAEEGFSNGTDKMATVISTKNFDLLVDFKSTAIAVVDNRDPSEPVTYHSDPNRSGDGSLSTALQLEAYDSTNKKYEFNTTDNCIADGEYKIVKVNENTVRLIYTIGNDPDKDLVPPVLTQESYDRIITALKAKYEETKDEEYNYMQDDLSNLYKRLDPETLSMDDKENYQPKFPTVTIRPLYVSREKITQKQKKLIATAMTTAGFTVAMLKEELNVVEYSGEARAVLFTIPVDITVNDDGISVDINSKKILSPEKQKLYKISVYPQFAAVKNNTSTPEEYIILPDGSGTLMKVSANLTADTYRSRIYGEDKTFEPKLDTIKSEQALSGFYIFDRGYRGGFMSIIEDGAAQAFLRASPMKVGGESETQSKGLEFASANFELVYAERDYRTYGTQTDSTKKQTAQAVGSGVITSKSEATTNFKIKYIFNDKTQILEQPTYSEYAKLYREYLIKNNKLSKEKVTQTKTPFYLELMGAIDKTVSKFGVPVDIKQPLTDYEDAKKIVQSLYDRGISGDSLKVIYSSWSNDGYSNTVFDKVNTMSEMGSKKELDSLAQLLSDNSSGFYPSADFLYVYKDSSSDGLNYQKDAARRLDMRIAQVHMRNLATGHLYNNSDESKTVISSDVFAGFAASYKTSFEKTFQTKQLAMISMGKDLNSNYKTGSVITRQDALQDNIDLLDTFSDFSLMVEKGNDYTWKYADYITGFPEGSSELLSTTEAIPFMQIVLHGYVNYVGKPFNVASDYTTSILKSVETGAGVYFKWMAAENDVFAHTMFYDFYSLNYNNSMEEAMRAYEQVSKIVDKICDQVIVKHEDTDAFVVSPYIGDLQVSQPGDPNYIPGKVTFNFDRVSAENVYTTTYENGIEVVVNYNSYDIELGDAQRTVVKSNSYIYREGENSKWIG